MAIIAASLIAGCGETPEALLASSKEYLAKNDNKAAIIQLKNTLQKDPDLAEARFLLGKALLESGDVSGAEKELQRALELQYPAELVVPLWARSLVMLGQYKKITEELAKVEVPAPQGKAELLTAVGEAHLALRNVNAARDAFAAALAAQPDYVAAHVGEARITAEAGHLTRASSMVDAALAISPSDPDAWQLKGDILVAQKQLEPALAAYGKAVQAKPDFVAGHTSIVMLLIQENRLEDAAKQLDTMKQFAPKHPQTLYVQALLAYRQKSFPAAREAIQQQLRAAPDNLPGLLLAGGIELELESYGQAEAHLLKVLQRAPQERLARRILVASYLRSGQAAKALDALKPVLDNSDKDANMLALAGEVFIMNGEPGRAADYFAKAAALDPGDAAKRTSLALSRVAKGDTDKAFRELERSAATDSGIRGDLAIIATHIQRREHDKALTAIAALEKKQPGAALPHNLRGGVLLSKRDPAGARRSFERALVLDPTYFPAAAGLAQLDLADKKPDAARKRFEAILTKDPKNMLALLGLAALRIRTGEAPDGRGAAGGATRVDPEVVTLISTAISAHPTVPAPRLALIRYYMDGRDAKRAAMAAKDALAAMPDRPEILDAAGRAQQAAGESQQALITYKKLASLQTGSPHPYLRMAEVQLAAKNTEDAMESLRKALAIKPDLLEAQRAVVTLELDAGRMKEAMRVALEVQKQRPKESAGYVFEGDSHAAQKKWREAATAYRAGLKQVTSTDLAVRLHTALAAGAGTEADPFAATWLKNHPKDGVFRLHLAHVAGAKKDYANAAQHYRKVLNSEPNNIVALNNLAWVEGQLKDPKAVEHAEKANQLAPNQPAFMDTLGVLLVDNGEPARGLELLQKASAAAPQAALIRLNLAKALIKVGQKDAARKELDELAKLGDKFSRQSEVAQLKQGL